MRAVLTASGTSAVAILLALFISCSPEGDGLLFIEEVAGPTPQADGDLDGYTVDDGDCDDSSALIHPDAAEGSVLTDGTVVGDGIDNNCDGVVDEGTTSFDDDKDGYSEEEGDCDDTTGQVSPVKVDGCDGIDNDCDGDVDEDARDDQEPNDTAEDAYDLGDISCTYEVAEFNIHDALDVDFFKFSVLDGSGECSLGVTVYLPDDDDFDGVPERDFWMQLYTEESDGSLTWLDSSASTVSDDTIGTGSGDSNLGVYYLQIAPAATVEGEDYYAITCNDTARVSIYGIQGYDTSSTRSGETTGKTASEDGR